MSDSDDIFDSIRVKPRKTKGASAAATRQEPQVCQWKGCTKPATHKAPKGRGKEGQFFSFCIDHVREYNKKYNYFEGMPDEDISQFQADAATGHRPTWQMGRGAAGEAQARRARVFSPRMRYKDPSQLLGGMDVGDAPAGGATAGGVGRGRMLGRLEKRYLRTLNLADDATGDEIKSRYKDLVKQHHPDVNGGDRTSEDKLREVIQAYNYLKQAGFC